jgi:mono/diheme cytochrome c family protein
MPKEKPPIHLIHNMDTQDKYKPQRESNFFEDGLTMRPLVEGTVARGDLREDDAYYRGENADGTELQNSPVTFTRDVLERGQERYGIYCTPCHGSVGDGQGIIMKYKYPIPPTSFHIERIQNVTDGYIYKVISNGVRNMPSYKEQIPVADRWAIVGYVRALQLSQNATAADVPDDVQASL